MTSVVCNVPVLSQNDSTYHHSVFTTWKWHPFATWTPSFIILVWWHHPLLRRTLFACLQNCYNSCISCSRSALRYDSINSNLMNYSWTNGRLAILAPAGLGFLLNVSRVAARLMSVGRAFHRRGAAELKALSPTRTWVRGTNSSEFVAERRLVWRWSEETGCSMSEMYAGAVLFNDLYTSMHILNSIRAALSHK